MDRFLKPVSNVQYFQSLREEDTAWRLKQMELSSESEAGEDSKSNSDVQITGDDSQGEKPRSSHRKPRFRLSEVLERLAKKHEGRSDSGNPHRVKYVNWFERPDDWKKIEQALKICRFSPRGTVKYLRLKYNKPGIQNQFLGLNESTIRGWLTPDKKLKSSVLELVRHPNYTGEQFGPTIVSGVEGPNPPVMQRVLQRDPELQPADVIIQRPFKAAFQQFYGRWYVEQIGIALSAGIQTINPKFDFSVGRMRTVAVEGLLHAHSQILMRRNMIIEGWRQCMLLEAWNSTCQMEAFKSFCDGKLFPPSVSGDAVATELSDHEEEPNDEDWHAEESVDEIMCQRLGIASEIQVLETTPESEQITDFCITGNGDGRVNFTNYLCNPASQTPYSEE
ncbi:hypothetical protein R1sor_006794 [Riccia sorocarpa]|uniref:Uncharacterized protein n=1 Tax=Riccia sorocarpa TaxID=122646 RepID=A0ABD3HNY2_9MARC